MLRREGLALIGCSVLLFSSLLANTITVATSTDSYSASPISLRYAILNAASGDTINFAPAVTAITLAGPLPAITQETLTISASSLVTIHGNNFPVFSCVQPNSNGSLTLINLSVSGGQSQGGSGGFGDNGGGGGGGAGGGGGLYIHTGSNVAISQVSLTNSKAQGGAGGAGSPRHGGLDGLGGGGGGGFGSGGAIGNGNGGLSDASAGTSGGGGGGSPYGGVGGDDTMSGGTVPTALYFVGGGGGGGANTPTGGGGNAIPPPPPASNQASILGGSHTGSLGSSAGGGGAGTSQPGGQASSSAGAPGGLGIGVDQWFGGGGGGGVDTGFSLGGSGTGTGGGGGAYKTGGSGGPLGGGGGAGGMASRSSGGFPGGNGGFGGGGGGGYKAGGSSAFAGGSGGLDGGTNIGCGGGGGGAALGGNVFICPSGTLTIGTTSSISGGTLQAGAGGTGGSVAATSGQALGADIFMCSSSTLKFQNAGTITIPTNIDSDQQASGAFPSTVVQTGGGLVISGASIVTLQGSNSTFTDSVTINTGTLSVSANGCLGDTTLGTAGNTVNIVNGTLQTTASFSSPRSFFLSGSTAIFNTDVGTALTLTGSVSGAGTLQKVQGAGVGTGTLIFNGSANSLSYTGGTQIISGTLSVQGASKMPSSGFVQVGASGAVFTIASGTSQTIGDLADYSSGGGDVYLGLNTLTFGTATLSSPFSGKIHDSGAVVKQGSGTAILSGASDYSGGTTLAAGTLGIAQNTSLGTAGGALRVSGAATLQVNYAGTMTHPIEIQNSSTLTLSTAQSVTIQNPITETSSGGALTIAGGGVITLQGTNTYSGLTTIDSATLVLPSAVSIADSTGVLLTSGSSNAVLQVAGTQTIGSLSSASQTSQVVFTAVSSSLTFGADNLTPLTFAGVISDGGNVGAVTKQGTGTEIFTNANTYTGGTTINEGTLSLQGLGTLYSAGAVIVNAPGVFDISHAGASFPTPTTVTIRSLSGTGSGQVNLGLNTLQIGPSGGTSIFAGVINDGGAIEKLGVGTLIFTNANQYTGGTTISGGILSLQGSGALVSTSSVTVANGATFDISLAGSGPPTTVTIGDLSGVSGSAITLGDNTLKVGTSGSTSFAGAIHDMGILYKQGLGTLTLSGSSDYSGGTILAAGVLSIGQSASLGASGTTLNVIDNATLQINYSNPLDPMDHPILITAGKTLQIDTNGNTPTISAAIGQTASKASMQKIGSGTLTLSATNSYGGTTGISAGTLILASVSSDCISSSELVSLSVSGAALELSTNQVIQDLSGISGTSINLNSYDLTFGAASNQTFAGTISGIGGSLTKQGGGIATLIGNSSYTGGTTLNAGVLSIGLDTSIGQAGTTLTVGGDATLQFQTAYAGSMSHPVQIDPGVTFTVDTQNNSVSFAAAINETAPPGSLSKIGSGQLTLSVMNNYTGQTTVNAGTLELTPTASIANSLGVSLANEAILQIEGSQTIQGLEGSSGTQVILLSSSPSLTFGVNTPSPQTFAGVISGAGPVTKQGTGTAIFTGANTYTQGTSITQGTLELRGTHGSLASSGDVDVSSGAFFDMSALAARPIQEIGNLTGAGTVQLGPHLLIFGGSTGSWMFSGQITGLGAVVKKGADIAIFTGASNSYTGGTTIRAGTLSLQGSGQLSSTSPVIVQSQGTFDIASAGLGPPTTIAIGGLSGAGTVTLGANTLQFGTNRNRTFSGVIQDSGSIIKVGTGTATFKGANTFLGGTTINAGTLSLLGSLASGVTVNNTGILRGTGTVGGTVTVNNGGTIRPGASIGTITVGNLSLSASSTTYIEMQPQTGSQSSAASSIHVLNIAALDGNVLLQAAAGSYPSFAQYIILVADGSLLGSYLLPVQYITGPGFQTFPNATVFNSGNTVILQLGEVPPPVIDTGLLDGNQNGQHLADYLNKLNQDPILGPVVFDLSQLSAKALNAAINSISPARNATGRFVAQNTMFLLANTVSCRMAQQRLTMRDLQMRKVEIPEQMWVGLAPYKEAAKPARAEQFFSSPRSLEESFLKAPKTWGAYVQEDKEGSNFDAGENPEFFDSSPRGQTTVVAKREKHYALWLEGVGEWIYQGPRHANPAYAAYTGGGLLGFDYYGNEGGLLSAAAGYAKSRIQESSENPGDIMLDTYMGTLFGTIAIGHGYIEMGAAGSWNTFHNRRKVTYPHYQDGIFEEIADSSCSGAQIVPHLGAGYDWNFSWATLEPFLAFDAAILYQASYTETGAFPLNMRVPHSWSALFRAEFGFHAYEMWTTPCGDFVLRETISFVSKKPYSIGDMFPNIVGYPPGFSLASFTNVQNFFVPGFQFLYRSPYGAFFSLAYMGEFQGNKLQRYTSQNLLAQLGLYF